ncbi:MAG: hypothetical protein K2M27_05905 [Muribaculaceae bacterium]|nr:hypothetical protein [Muribaculaceae bacterium]
MWHLDSPSKADLDRYCDLLRPKIKKHLSDLSTTMPEWCGVLNNDNLLDDILTARPERLFKLNTEILNKLLIAKQCESNTGHAPFGFTYSERQLRHYLKFYRKNINNLTDKNKQRVNRYKDLFSFLDKVFNYADFNSAIAYEVAKMKGRNTCTYCNRQYTFTVGQEDTNGVAKSKTRPQFDHWFAHSHYPLLSLSFYNLIPSCPVCNSAAKGTTHYSLKTHIHPYTTESPDPDLEFRPELKTDEKDGKVRWSVKLVVKVGSKEERMIKDLMLEELYACHGPLELKDIMDFRMKNNPTYLKTLFKKICRKYEKERSINDVYRMMFGVERNPSKILDRPLSKFKRDILRREGIE